MRFHTHSLGSRRAHRYRKVAKWPIVRRLKKDPKADCHWPRCVTRVLSPLTSCVCTTQKCFHFRSSGESVRPLLNASERALSLYRHPAPAAATGAASPVSLCSLPDAFHYRLTSHRATTTPVTPHISSLYPPPAGLVLRLGSTPLAR
jgi:hypothetical protein